MRGTDPNALRRQQKHAVCDAEKAAALTDQLCQTCMTAGYAMNFLVYLVDQFELFLGDLCPADNIGELVVDSHALADYLHRREQNILQQTRIE